VAYEKIDELTHKISITIYGRYTDGYDQHAHIEVHGDGGLEHMMDAFRAALLASGFAVETVNSVKVVE